MNSLECPLHSPTNHACCAAVELQPEPEPDLPARLRGRLGGAPLKGIAQEAQDQQHQLLVRGGSGQGIAARLSEREELASEEARRAPLRRGGSGGDMREPPPQRGPRGQHREQLRDDFPPPERQVREVREVREVRDGGGGREGRRGGPRGRR
jgi:hypothetical protein